MGRTMRQLFRLEPLDTLFFRGGRPFGPTARGESGLPKPQTIAGALRTALLNKAGIEPADVGKKIRAGEPFATAAAAFGEAGAAIGRVQFRGPWLGRNGALMYPMPAALREVKGEGRLVRLDPLPGKLPGWRPKQASMNPLWWPDRERLTSASGYVTAAGMSRYLRGAVPHNGEILPNEELFGFDERTGIGLNVVRRVVEEGYIYSARMLALRPNVYLYVEIAGLNEVIQLFPQEGSLIRLGGEGRRVAISPEDKVAAEPAVGAPSNLDGFSVVLTTAALAGGWRPVGLNPVAAAVPGYEAISGWDLARGGPKPNRFALPAGSVFFMRPGASVKTISKDADLGWGSFLTGAWKYVHHSESSET